MPGAAKRDEAFETVGPREYLDRLLTEYQLDEQELGDQIRVRTPPRWLPNEIPTQEYLVDASLLRSHGDFACAGDTEALAFCENIINAMTTGYGISRNEAVARLNKHWSHADPPGRVPRVWIVGLDIVYHEEAESWAALIYYGPDSRWWDPETSQQPLPLP
ncbi:hypothetical protein [Micromonospora sp. 067-2]|uniref:hypothetical protein n=1 Tax=Micromonospora sp. 067-2 TaxID=2789270 RepID=UPI00397C5DE6